MASSPPVANVANGATAPAPRSSKLLIGLLVGVSLIAAAAVGYVFVIGPKAAHTTTEAAKPVVPEKPIFVTLEPLTVNLQGEGRGKFLHIGMSLKVRDEPAKAQIVEFMPELRSRVLLLLSNRLPESLVSTEDKSKLAEEIRTELNRPLADNLPSQGIASVSFNTFVVQ
ncbi:flagellar basal body-associated protein FliL [Variovorax sp. J22R24]|uniref:flagellar basal body-associated protein FliL n=1 Tax=Variovorax gracilis TaxID=3053502 RepID=UPI0025783150|nr:flagellar basal body-associated protein FliL [Variovorax sp. J22R24]MDM0104355.1 flagellar basal body-associated protein FliL [Variovorax sp. J22R24]